jgi:hypothetical protein
MTTGTVRRHGNVVGYDGYDDMWKNTNFSICFAYLNLHFCICSYYIYYYYYYYYYYYIFSGLCLLKCCSLLTHVIRTFAQKKIFIAAFGNLYLPHSLPFSICAPPHPPLTALIAIPCPLAVIPHPHYYSSPTHLETPPPLLDPAP